MLLLYVDYYVRENKNRSKPTLNAYHVGKQVEELFFKKYLPQSCSNCNLKVEDVFDHSNNFGFYFVLVENKSTCDIFGTHR